MEEGKGLAMIGGWAMKFLTRKISKGGGGFFFTKRGGDTYDIF